MLGELADVSADNSEPRDWTASGYFDIAAGGAEYLQAIQLEATRHQAALGSGQILVPNRFWLTLGEKDFSDIGGDVGNLAQWLAQEQAQWVGEQRATRLVVVGDIIVELTVSRDVVQGTFAVQAAVESSEESPAD